MSKFDVFGSKFAQDIYLQKYSMNQQESWADTCRRVVSSVCGQLITTKEQDKIFKLMLDRKFIPAGRYLYSSGRPFHQLNNCFLFRAEDSREGWADATYKATSALMTGGGIGFDYSLLRENGAIVKRTGGVATGPLALLSIINETGRYVMQGGQRRCLPGTATILMADGSNRLIKDVIAGDYVTTRFGSRRVLATASQGIQALLKIETEHGTTYSTKNHKWLGADLARNKGWITAERLKVGGKLYNHPTSADLAYQNEDLNFWYMIGYFIGDGCAYSSGRTHEITFQFSDDWKDDAQLARISTVMQKLGTNPILRKGHGACTELRCRSRKLVEFFQTFKTPHSPPNLTEIMKLSARAKAIVLAGWLDADGYLNQDKWCISNKHDSTAQDLRCLFRSIGILTSINKSTTANEIRISSYQKAALSHYLNEYSLKIHNTPFFHETSEIPSVIHAITPVGAQETYDLQIEEVEEFIADGFVSHNSAIYGSLNWKHPDIYEFMNCKNHSPDLKAMKEKDFTFPLPYELTNISVNYDTEFFIAIENKEHPLHARAMEVFVYNCRQAFSVAEPGFSFNFLKDNETLRNAPVTAATRVLTSEGYVEVGSVVDKPITVWTGQQWAPTMFKKTKEDAPLVKVELTNGRSIVCDPDHPFIVKNYIGAGKNKKIELIRVPASRLNVDDKIRSDLPTDTINKDTALDIREYALGFVFGDGSIKDKRGEISYHSPSKKRCFDLALDGLNAHCVSKDNRAYFKVDIDHKNALLDVGVLSCDFIAGWFDADGCYTRGLLRLSSSVLDNLKKCQESLDFYGIKSTIRHDGFSAYSPSNLSFTLTVLSDSFFTFKQQIKTVRLELDMEDDWQPYRESEIRVKSVEALNYREDVYCCDVGVPEHSFMAEGVIISNCCEVVSEDDSDKCNLGTLWINRFKDRAELQDATNLATLFLLCGGIYSDLPNEKIREVGNKNNRIGLGLGGIHEWLLMRGSSYSVTPELHKWLRTYEQESNSAAFIYAKQLNVAIPKGKRAIAPTGTLGIIAETTTGIEPLFCKAYKRRYFKDGKWLSQYVIDGAVKRLIDNGVNLDMIQDSYDLSFQQRVKFQADVQNYVDMAISSTCNLPSWGSPTNNEETIEKNTKTLLKYAKRLRGFTCYPDACRGGQPLTRVELSEALEKEGVVFEEQERECLNGVCGL